MRFPDALDDRVPYCTAATLSCTFGCSLGCLRVENSHYFFGSTLSKTTGEIRRDFPKPDPLKCKKYNTLENAHVKRSRSFLGASTQPYRNLGRKDLLVKEIAQWAKLEVQIVQCQAKTSRQFCDLLLQFHEGQAHFFNLFVCQRTAFHSSDGLALE